MTWIEFSQSMIASVIGASIAILPNLFIEKYKFFQKNVDKKISKLEELCELTDLLQKEVVEYILIKENKINKSIINQSNFNPARMSCIVRFYFPHILNEYQALALEYIKIINSNLNDIEKENIDKFNEMIKNFYNLLEKEAKKLIEKSGIKA
jgi:hypothetical protein